MSDKREQKVREVKKTSEPIFWLLFGMGGTFTALLLPAVLVVAIFGIFFIPEATVWLLTNPFGKLLLVLAALLVLWSAIHSIRHLFHDLKIHIPADKVLFYGVAFILSIVVIVKAF